MGSALNTLQKMPNFPKEHNKFLFKLIGREAKRAAKILKEEQPANFDREALKQFSFNSYYDELLKVAPSLTTTIVAASTKIKHKAIKVQSSRISNKVLQGLRPEGLSP